MQSSYENSSVVEKILVSEFINDQAAISEVGSDSELTVPVESTQIKQTNTTFEEESEEDDLMQENIQTFI